MKYLGNRICVINFSDLLPDFKTTYQIWFIAVFFSIFIFVCKTYIFLENICTFAYCSRLNPGARGEHLAIQLSWMAPWLLVKRVCPVHLVERWGCRSWTVVMAINKLFNYLLIRAGSMVDISPGSHRWNPGSIPQRRQKIILSYCHGNGLGKWWGRLWGSV